MPDGRLCVFLGRACQLVGSIETQMRKYAVKIFLSDLTNRAIQWGKHPTWQEHAIACVNSATRRWKAHLNKCNFLHFLLFPKSLTLLGSHFHQFFFFGFHHIDWTKRLYNLTWHIFISFLWFLIFFLLKRSPHGHQ